MFLRVSQVGLWHEASELMAVSRTLLGLPALSPIRLAHFEEDAAVMFLSYMKENNTYVIKLREVALKMAVSYFLNQHHKEDSLLVDKFIK
jgi:hypothetical protein